LSETFKKKQNPDYNGIFDDYFNTLPSDGNDFPESFSKDDLSFLTGSLIMQKSLQKKAPMI
jgi:hypothetical protein